MPLDIPYQNKMNKYDLKLFFVTLISLCNQQICILHNIYSTGISVGLPDRIVFKFVVVVYCFVFKKEFCDEKHFVQDGFYGFHDDRMIQYF